MTASSSNGEDIQETEEALEIDETQPIITAPNNNNKLSSTDASTNKIQKAHKYDSLYEKFQNHLWEN